MRWGAVQVDLLAACLDLVGGEGADLGLQAVELTCKRFRQAGESCTCLILRSPATVGHHAAKPIPPSLIPSIVAAADPLLPS